jgi:predicted Ser/Thr protein kinase
MEPPPASPAGQSKAPSRTSLPRLSEISTPDDGRFLPGTLVNGRYRIVGLLGRGGMGEVYRATDLTLAQPVALKFLPEAGVTERILERFHAEVRIARQISHPNVCRVYDIGEVDGQPFISMEYVDGEDLADLLQRIGRLPADKALETARKICAGLAAAHDKGVIHRDLKPQNIMLNKRGEPVIMDFGLAAVADQLTGAEARNGTPAYMSPEQLRGDEVTARSDIYALGLVLYEIFSGKRAYEARTAGDLLKLQEGVQLTSITTLASDVDPLVEKTIKRCLSPDPAQRPATPLAVAAALPGGDPLAAALAAGETPSPEMVAASGATEGMDLRYSMPILLFVLAVIFVVPFAMIPASTLQRTPVSYPPVIAGYQARKIAASFGYTQAPVDTFVDFANGGPAVDYWKTHNRKGKSWEDLLGAEPAYRYFYRESPSPLIAWPRGDVDADTPAPVTAGMLDMRLNFAGHLREFQAIPPEKPAAAPPGTPFNEAVLFKALGYDPAGFTETPPQVVPMVAYDLRKAWKGPAPGLPDVEVRIEAASLAGRITAVKVVLPWTNAQREPDKPAAGAALFGPLVAMGMTLTAMLFGLIFAVRNLRLNRADKKGALRLALVVGFLALIAWVGSAHHVAAPDEWELLSNEVADAGFTGLALWVLYVALEPMVRSHWPQAMVTWNRLLSGRFGDAQLGAHILTGAAIGLALRIALTAPHWIDYRHDGVPFGDALGGSQSALAWIGSNAQQLQSDLQSGFIVFFAIFGFRALWKNDYAAAFTTAALFAAVSNNGIWSDSNPHLILERSVLLGIFAVLAFILIRMGMVSSVAALFFINTPDRINLGPGLSGWYTPYGLATMALLTAVAIYAFWRSIGARTLGDKEIH